MILALLLATKIMSGPSIGLHVPEGPFIWQNPDGTVLSWESGRWVQVQPTIEDGILVYTVAQP
jgi:hypothetical protein